MILAVTTGLRRSELFALKWRDVDFSTFMLDVQRSIYLGKIGHCKTDASRKPVPLFERVAADLWLWKETSKYRLMDDWIFASPHTDGRHPSWPDAVLQKVIRPAALRAGIRKVIGWHTFRHTYTLEIYTQARTEQKRKAQQRLAEAIFPDDADIRAPIIQGISQDNLS